MHKCLKCRVKYKEITEAMLGGCPECGSKYFLYVRGESSSTEELVDLVEIDDCESVPLEGEKIESLRILSPGVYELNLNTILERNEIIMQIKENGTYVIPLPSLFRSKKRKKKR